MYNDDEFIASLMTLEDDFYMDLIMPVGLAVISTVIILMKRRSDGQRDQMQRDL